MLYIYEVQCLVNTKYFVFVFSGWRISCTPGWMTALHPGVDYG